MTHLILWSVFASQNFCGDRSTLDGGGKNTFPLSLDASKTRPSAASSQPTEVFGICYGLQELFGEFPWKTKGKGHDINETRKQPTGPIPHKIVKFMGGSQAFVGGVPRLKNFNIFWPLVDVEVVFVMSRWWNGEMCGRFGVDEVKESWENEGGKRWFPPRKNILNNWYENFYITINSWCFGSVFSLQ